MKHKAFLCLVLSALLLAGCAPRSKENNTTAPDKSGASVDSQDAVQTQKALSEIKALGQSPDDNYRIWYEIFVYSYCDSNGDGIGDLQGVISKLDELEALGVNGIWLMPIHPSTTYHKYNVSDYYEIDPTYGTLEDFESLMAQCQSRGIRVILDLVINHTGSDHPWFREACTYLAGLSAYTQPDSSVCPYVDYYNFVKADIAPAAHTAAPGASGWYYESQFSQDMPDLNLGNPALREDIKKIMEFWLGKGVSGFRLDAAKEFYTGQTDKNVEVLHWIQQTANAIDPDCYLVAEVWDSFAVITDYYESGITSIFNYAFGNSNGKIINVLKGAGNAKTVSSYATALETADKAYRGNNPDYIDAPFLSNHDVGRIAGFVARDEAKTKLAGAMNIFMSGSVFIYYGEELGMVCGGINDPSFRAPMYWSAEGGDGTTQPPAECTLPDAYPMGSLAQQRGNDASVYNYYRQAIAIRNALPVISHGVTTAETALNTGCISAQRKTWNDETCIILMNIDAKEARVDLSGYTDYKLAASLSANGEDVEVDGTMLHMPAYGVAVLLPAA